MRIETTRLPGVLRISPRVFRDDRGFFFESWKRTSYADAGVNVEFVQFNISRSVRGVLRGLHYQEPNPQGKLVSVLQGTILDVAVDIRPDSPTFAQWESFELKADEFSQIYIPEGFAHGFIVLSDYAMINYLCTREYNPDADAGIAWNDPDIGIDWRIEPSEISAKDAAAPRLAQVPANRLPSFSAATPE